MNTIKGRILSAFAILFLLSIPFVVYTASSLHKIYEARAIKEDVVSFNVNSLGAINKFLQLIAQDTKLDEFYTTKITKNISDYRTNIAASFSILKKINQEEYPISSEYLKDLDRINYRLAEIDNNIEKIILLQQKRGHEDFGMEGQMRKNIHQLEHEAKEITLAENLSLRRREKDFFLRHDARYSNMLNKQCEAIKKRLSQNLATYSGTLEILENYQWIFNQIVELDQQIDVELSQVNLKNQQLSSLTGTLIADVSDDVAKLENDLLSSILLYFGITVILAIILALVFSAYLARPIEKLMVDMDKIAKNKFKGDTKIENNVRIKELRRLTKTYNGLVAKIRAQVKSLNENNEELQTLNSRLTQSESELKEASKIKDKFFSIISHDLRNHTGNILSIAKILDDDLSLADEEKNTFIKHMVDSSQNLRLLLDNLLNWAKSQMNDHDINKRSFDLNTLLNKNVLLFKDNAYRKGVDVYFEPINIPKVYADKDMIDFIIRNLLSNALKYSRNEDFISIKAEQLENDFLKVNVIDTGVGMTQEQIDQLLNSTSGNHSTTGTDNEVGTGLGFAISKDFVIRNGGEISIASKLNAGSTFSFTIPTALTTKSIIK